MNLILIIITTFIILYLLSYICKRVMILEKFEDEQKLIKDNNNDNIEKLTDNWIHVVCELKDPEEVSKLFCKDGMLFGTVSQTLRRGKMIEKYFDYFAKLPGLKVTKKKI